MGPSRKLAVSLVSGFTPEPSGFITQMFGWPLTLLASVPSRARFEVNMILLSSGDHEGKSCAITEVSAVRAARPVPSAFITQMLTAGPATSVPSAPRVEPKMIFVPSREKAGRKLLPDVSLVSAVWLDPSGSITQIFCVEPVVAVLVPLVA